MSRRADTKRPAGAIPRAGLFCHSTAGLAAAAQPLVLFPGGVACRPSGLPLALLEGLVAPVALDVHLEDGGVVDEPVDGGHRGCFVGEHLVPRAEGLVCGDQQGAPLVARRDEFEEYAGLGLVILDIGDVVEDQEVEAVEPGQHGFQGELAARDLEALDQIGGSGEQDAVSVLDQGEADGGRQMALADSARDAVVYIRQSTPDHLRNNHESRRRQYGLADRARGLGWDEPLIIDDDLGRSGGGTLRPGFERLLLAVCEGRVGIVLSLEASRLARNGREWHTLLEFCALVGCLLGDEDGLYDPRLPNDRLLPGMKGTLSEMELSTLRQRSLEALRLKASRCELFLTVAVGYVKVGRDRIAKDPDERVREAIDLVFRKFAEFRSIRQVHLWLR